MTQENKKLLLQDLCAKLPYGIKAFYYGAEEECETWEEIEGITCDGYVDIGQYSLPTESVKPYLFPLSSMTDEQKKEYYNLCFEEEREEREYGEWITRVYYHNTIESIDWLNKNHFDYRDLIEKGHTIDATGLNIY